VQEPRLLGRRGGVLGGAIKCLGASERRVEREEGEYYKSFEVFVLPPIECLYPSPMRPTTV